MITPIARLEAALEQIGAEHEPPWGWETRVLAVTGQRPPRRRWWFAMQVVALAAIGLVFLPRPRPANHNLALEVIRDPSGPPVRGRSASVGCRVHVTATSGDRYRAIWVYRNEHELVAACPDGLSCQRSGDTTTVDVTLQAIGSYTFVSVTSTSPLPEPRGSYDHDRAAAQEAGASIQHDVIEVR